MFDSSFVFDLPLLIVGLIAMIVGRFVLRPVYYHAMCQFISTVWAQYSWFFVISLARLAPIFAATNVPAGKSNLLNYFVPFFVYVMLFGVIASLFWEIPADVAFIYGPGRFFIQAIVFVSLGYSAKAFLNLVRDHDATIIFWKMFCLTVIVHGLASVYQYIASALGLPLLAVSRSFDQTLEVGLGDIAAFATEAGDIILRPGGLAGEPKTVAALFATYLLAQVLVGAPAGLSRSWRALSVSSTVLCTIGFVGAFSTSAIIGLLVSVSLVIGMFWFRLRAQVGLIVGLLGLILSGIAIVLSSQQLFSSESIISLLTFRTVGRFDNFELDPPVQAAIEFLSASPLALLFGTGIGGGSFEIQRILNYQTALSLAPNIGFVLLILEVGLVGTLMLLVPFFSLFFRVRKFLLSADSKQISDYERWEISFLLLLGLSALMQMLGGSGFAMGYPIAVGSVVGAAEIMLLGPKRKLANLNWQKP